MCSHFENMFTYHMLNLYSNFNPLFTGQQANAGYAAGGGAAQGQQVKVVPHVYQQPVPTTTPAPATKSPLQYLYEPHSCPKMDVATWENEVVIYDNKNCAM